MGTEQVLVVGCGVIGLTSGIELQRAGYRVTIAARELPPHTVSTVAAAIWSPYAVAPRERCEGWARASYRVFGELARDPASGVTLRSGVELHPPGSEAPGLLRELPNARSARAEELRPGYTSGVVFDAPVIETPIHVPWLMQKFQAAGGSIEVAMFGSLDAALARAPIVINCSGLGARELAPDASVYSIRGQILRVERGALERFALGHDPAGGTTYVIPRSNDCILGGTREEHSVELLPNAIQTDDIQRRCRVLVPELGEREVLETLVGRRPGRPSVRLEPERRAGGLIVHNYGHGGGGVTLSWGCAHEVLEVLREQ